MSIPATASSACRAAFNDTVKDYRKIITIEPGKRSGKPCIRGLRIYDILGYLAGGMSNKEIIDDFPELTEEDIGASLAYAAAQGTNAVKLLYDQNLSRTLVDRLAADHPQSVHKFHALGAS